MIPTEPVDYITPNDQKVTVLFRPINVPFKNKWLRDSVRDLESSIHILQPEEISNYSKAVFARMTN